MSIIRIAFQVCRRATAAAVVTLSLAASAEAQFPLQRTDTLLIEEVLQQRAMVDSAQSVAEEALRRTGAEIATAFKGLSDAYRSHEAAMEAWLSEPNEETETSYVEARARSVNSSVRHLDPIVALKVNLRRRVAPIDRMLRGHIRNISERLVGISGQLASIQVANADHQTEYDRLALKLVQTGQINTLDALSLEEKADLMGLETNVRMLAFVEATMSRHEIHMRAARERFRLFRQSLENSVVLAGAVGEQAQAMQGALQTVAFTSASEVQVRDVERAFEGVLSLEEGLQGAAFDFLDQGMAIEQFAVADPTRPGAGSVAPLDVTSLGERLRARGESLINQANR